MTHTDVVVVAPFPPPLGGAAHVTEAVTNRLRSHGLTCLRLDTSAHTLAHQRSFSYHAHRMLKAAGIALRLLVSGRNDGKCYVVPDGGNGVWYSLAFAVIAAARTRQLVVHHHSCRYIASRDAAMAALVRITRSKAHHVFLTDGMRARFETTYGAVDGMVLQNAAFTSVAPEVPPPHGGHVRLGHLSNLCSDKGFFTVADTFETLASRYPQVHLDLAGPILEERVRLRIDHLVQQHPGRVTYRGAIHGDEKAKFYAGLDCFLFPTQFRQEAAPNVIYEAASRGVPTLATDVGCITEMVTTLGGISCATPDGFRDMVEHWLALERASSHQRRLVKDSFDATHVRALSELDALVSALS